METKVIRTEDQYRQYLQEVQYLVSATPSLSSSVSEKLELLTVLIESYERLKYPVELPDPIDAIVFRMQEKGFKQADLVPYLGTKSRVSEVLARKRPLTVQMIRALSVGLGISVETLVGVNSSPSGEGSNTVEWKDFPVKEICKRGWLTDILNRKKLMSKRLLEGL